MLGVTPEGTEQKIAAILRQFGLPTAIAAKPEDFSQTLSRDKKSDGDRISFVVRRELGRAETVALEKKKLLNLIREAKL